MENRVQLKKNVNRNYVFILLQNIDLTRGIWMLYLASKGMSLTQLGLLETIFHITSFTMEVPTGAVADIFGRKISRILGRTFSLISVILLLVSNSFILFAISFIFTALSYNLESGAGDALIYDSLKEIGEEESYMKLNGNKEVFFQLASIISFLVGGYLATKSYDIAFILTIIIGAITILQSFTFKEPSIGKIKEKKDNIFISQLKGSITVIKNRPKIAFLIVFTEFISTFGTCIFFYLQNYLKADGYNEAKIGFIYAISSVAVALVATQVHKIERKIKERGILLITPLLTAVSIWGIALSKYHYIFFILLMVTQGTLYVAMGDYINKMIPSENRATILSFSSMVFSFFMITIFPLIGYIGDTYSLSTAFRYLGVLGIAIALVNSYILIVKTNKVKLKKQNI
ncbi:MFS transporter [Caloranaerobacter sp. TR13]|uniref:MFS transporter n=1 Tax=Caloranaerobacter sp. TR13 TaxID=1302151 RepID=UPI0006D4728C|nr:MFS transporter [Caloranaerobacter sp. TR13]KPU26510.1 MFS transporter [Caloranaerobacter sp. TR13]